MILLDVDGVLADFIGHAAKVQRMKRTDSYPNDSVNIVTKAFWRDHATQEFWETMPILPFAKEIVEVCESYDDVTLCTNPMYGQGLAGRYNWIKKHFPEYKRKYIFTENKHLVRGILVDDLPKNIIDHPEEGILIPEQHNYLRYMPIVPFLTNRLKEVYGAHHVKS